VIATIELPPSRSDPVASVDPLLHRKRLLSTAILQRALER
jgi:hypothetical protein